MLSPENFKMRIEMNVKILIFQVLFIISIWCSIAIAEQQVIVGVYAKDLTEYSAEGKKLGVLQNVTEPEIKGTIVLARSPRSLLQVNFRGKLVWLRASQLILNNPILAKCPESAPGRSVDSKKPLAVGFGSKCE